MAREHPTKRFAACKTHFSSMMIDLMLDRGTDTANFRVDRIRRKSSERPTYVCSCRKPAVFFVSTALLRNGEGVIRE